MRTQLIVLTLLALFGMEARAAFSFGPYQTYAQGVYGNATRIGDIDGDGRKDVVMVNAASPQDSSAVIVYFQNQDGTLASPTKIGLQGFSGRALAVADLDADGRLDIVAGHSGGITVIRGHPIRKMLRGVAVPGPVTTRVDTTDVDIDGNLDIVGVSDQAVSIYYGDGRGGVREQAGIQDTFGYGDLKVGDLNGDMHDDVAITTPYNTVHIYLHDGVSRLLTSPWIVRPPITIGIGGIAIADFNDDGKKDLAVARSANSPTQIFLYYQQAGGFAAPVEIATYDIPGAMFGGDIDGDGRDDLLVAHGGWFALGLYLQGDSGLGPEVRSQAPATQNPGGLAAGDINGDGCIDASMATYTGSGLAVLLGRGCEANPDLLTAVGLTSTTAAVRLSHASGAADILQPLVRVEFDLRKGDLLEIEEVPAGCVIKAKTQLKAAFECLVETLSSGQAVTLIFGLKATITQRAMLSLWASAVSGTKDLNLNNNQAGTQLMLSPPPPAIPGAKQPKIRIGGGNRL